MDQLFVRELINACWSALAWGIVVVFGVFLWNEIKENGWYADHKNKAAVALIIYFTGETIGRAWTVSLLWSARVGYHPKFFESAYAMAIFGFLVAMVGGLCVIRIFSRDSWGNWPWFLTFLGCCLAAIITSAFN